MENFHQGGKYYSQIATKKAQLMREANIVDQKSLSISALQIDCYILENSVRNTEELFFSRSRGSQYMGSHPTEKCFKQKIKENGNNKSPFNS